MKATTTREFLHDELGRIKVGEFEVSAAQAASLRALGWVTISEDTDAPGSGKPKGKSKP